MKTINFLLTHLGFPTIPIYGMSVQASRPDSHSHMPLNRKTASSGFFVDPPGLEPGLCGTKIRRVTSYTMGQSILVCAAKLENFLKSDR